MSDYTRVFAGGEVLSEGPAVLWLATLAERQVHVMRANGVRNPAVEGWLADFIEGATRTRSAASGRRHMPIEPASAPSCLVDPVTTSEAATMLSRKTRNVVDLCQREVFTSARKVGGHWQIERGEVLARVERMAG